MNEISSLLVQFTELLEEQSESVTDIHRQSKVTTEHVEDVCAHSIASCFGGWILMCISEQSEVQLVSAIKSSASFRKMMVTLIMAMSFAVFMLDFLTP